MNAHLLKPFKAYELYNLMTSLLKSKVPEKTIKIGTPDKSEKATKITLQPTAPTMENGRPYDLYELFELGNNEAAFVKKMLHLFATNTRAHLSSMRKAANEDDWKTVGEMAHKIVPPTRHLGMNELVGKLKSIELDALGGKGADTLASRVRHVGDELDMVIAAVEEDIESL
jgi:HPt (histidine-containing phosphotransfer) domain-containing protein